MKGRLAQHRHLKLFDAAEGRLSPTAGKRMRRLLPKAGATEAEARKAYDKLYQFLLEKSQMCFPPRCL